jgi:23S rRNA (uracil1939-C5)-methyltransferase
LSARGSRPGRGGVGARSRGARGASPGGTGPVRTASDAARRARGPEVQRPARDLTLVLDTEPTLSHAQDATARAPDGRVVFVAGAAPGERVEAEVVQDTKSFLRARTLRVLTPSAARVAPRCPHVERCGGCTAQHVDAAAQGASKQASVLHTLRRIGGLTLDAAAIAPLAQVAPFGYRTRARLHVEAGPGGATLGYRARGSSALVPITACPVLTPALEARLPAFARAVAGLDGAAELLVLDAGDAILARVRAVAPGGASADAIEAAHARLTAEGLDARGAAVRVVDAIGERWASAEIFQQQSEPGNALLLDAVARLVEGDAAFAGEVLELYAGSGNFTRLLARRAARLTAVEVAGDAAALLERALVGAPRPVRLVAGDAGTTAAALDGPIDAALVDPPRAGLAPEVVEALARLEPRTLVYVSCDPATFARDARALGAAGWRVDHLAVLDLYPQTPHVELVARLTR